MNKCSFLIIADGNYHLTHNTLKVLSKIFENHPCLVVGDNNFPKEESDKLKCKFFKTTKSKNKFFDLINLALKKTETEWNLIITAGSYIKYSFYQRIQNMNPKENEIFYPLKYNKYNFFDADFNGIFLHKERFEKIGDFKSQENFEHSKVFWNQTAIENGTIFKGLLGLNFY
jgi:hypothetical protein